MENKPNPELDLDLDLSKLFLPAWVNQAPARDRFAKFEGEEESGKKPGRRARQQRKRPAQLKRTAAPAPELKPPKVKPSEPKPEAAPAPLPEVDVEFVPDEKCVESIVRQIKITGRAYPLFEIAKLVLQRPERHTVTFTSRKSPDGQLLQPLYVCALDDTLWLSQDEVAAYVLDTHFGLFYQTERVPTEPPKGKYTFVAQCGLSGVILGPPNHHDYQSKLVRLHQERFSNIPFEVFKSHVKIVRDEAVVKKWIEEQSWKTQYVCLNVPEPLRLETRQDVETHFRMVHLPGLVRQVESYTLSGAAARRLKCKGLRRVFHRTYEHQRRFPLQMATALSQRFAAAGLQFFKVNRTITHVSVARPRYLDLETTPVSESVRRIVQYINEHPRCTRRELIEALAPTPATRLQALPEAGQQDQAGAATKSEPVPEHTPEQLAVIADLHWLVHQGHVIEFADGRLETAKKPAPKPPKQKLQPAPEQSEQVESAQATVEQGTADAGGPGPVESAEASPHELVESEFEPAAQLESEGLTPPGFSEGGAIAEETLAGEAPRLDVESASQDEFELEDAPEPAPAGATPMAEEDQAPRTPQTQDGPPGSPPGASGQS